MVKGGVPESIDLSQERETVLTVLREIRALGSNRTLDEVSDRRPPNPHQLTPVLRRHPRPDGTFYAKSQLVEAYRTLVEEGALDPDAGLERKLRGRPVRTISGVAPVAVLTKPYPCPGTCIFCPDQQEAPKSYLDGEPGVLRAIQNAYDPYDQTAVRIAALDALGHATDKIELLILGGTWSYYPEEYQDHFLKRCFDAMNAERDVGATHLPPFPEVGCTSDNEAPALAEAMARNETALHRNVGITIETRPDWVTPEAVLRLRRQGVTKVQLGAQSFDDRILALNRRGHTLADTQRAIRLLRLGGFKIVLHWMPNLYGATPASDLADFARMWEDPTLRPDELKIYPTALLEGTELYELWQAGEYEPYAEETLIDLLRQCKLMIPPYCRVNRLMRDIPASYIVAGTTKSNLRQIIQQRMAKVGERCRCIRCREIRGRRVADVDAIHQAIVTYATDATEEHFIQYLTPKGYLAGFLRLSLPHRWVAPSFGCDPPEAQQRAMIRELHVYGPAQALGAQGRGAQHRGLGTQLLEDAAHIAREAGFDALAVIAAVGTRPYYRERGFTEGTLYPTKPLK